MVFKLLMVNALKTEVLKLRHFKYAKTYILNKGAEQTELTY